MATAGRGPAKARRHAVPALLDYARQHPVATAAVAVAVGAAAGFALKWFGLPALGKKAGAGAPTSGRAVARPPASASASGPRRTYDVGAADMLFSARRPGKKNIVFRFAWKKRPVNAPDADWPVDNMGFVAAHPNGRYTTFRMTRKTRPVPAARTGDSRPGLGQAEMEFISSRPGRKDFRFTWTKVPPNASNNAKRKGEDHGKERSREAAFR